MPDSTLSVNLPQSAENAVLAAVNPPAPAAKQESGVSGGAIVAAAAAVGALGVGAWWLSQKPKGNPLHVSEEKEPMNKRTKRALTIGIGAAVVAGGLAAYAAKKKKPEASGGVLSQNFQVGPGDAGRTFRVGAHDTVLVSLPSAQYQLQIQQNTPNTPAPSIAVGEGSGPYANSDGSVYYLLGATYPGSATVVGTALGPQGELADRLFWNFEVV